MSDLGGFPYPTIQLLVLPRLSLSWVQPLLAWRLTKSLSSWQSTGFASEAFLIVPKLHERVKKIQ